MKLVGLILLTTVVVVAGSRASKIIASHDKQCPAVERINKTSYPWNSYDKQTENFAKIRCGFKFEHSPCLVRFVKTGIRNFQVTCGAKR